MQRLLQQRRRVQFGQLLQRAQVTLTVGKQHVPRVGHRGVMADRGHGILQGPPPTRVHVHIAAGHRGNVYRRRQRQQLLQTLAVIGAAVQLHGQPQTLAEYFAQPMSRRRVRAAVRHPQRQQALQRTAEILAQQLVLALLRPTPAQGNQLAQCLIPGQILRQQHHLGPGLDLHFTANNQRQADFPRHLPGADDAGQGALIGNGQGFITMAFGPLEQLAGARRPALETEVGQAVQFCIPTAHANHPCSSSGPASPTTL
ncbi:hypothetical protein D3C76_1110670 [compost metagenome]